MTKLLLTLTALAAALSPVAAMAELEIKRWNPEGLGQPVGYS